ncbi:hypothetical protein [Candidatus Mesenet endosymbiont of Agriotes lineatus]|uniref:hypothetical protein n=1 Tax=Candidatus Mesenet endosymbiont of Agriotes lineatus TaxID=3077948 RepID=UPI0030D1CF96
MLSVDDEGENMKMTEYFKLPNTDNRMGFSSGYDATYNATYISKSCTTRAK